METTLLPHPPSTTVTAVAAPTAPTAKLAELAGQAKAGRNRAVDLYRAVAMLVVAFGHWLVMVAYRGADGELISGNALEFVPGFHYLTWVFQVMPLFFVVGGFASAASLDSKGIGRTSTAAQRSTWIAGRLARLLPPVAALGSAWLVAIVVGQLTGMSGLVNAAAIAAAIPLWFLANYVADVLLAPHVLPLFRRSPAKTAAAGLGIFALLELLRVTGALHPFGPLEHLPHVNWILGWFLFQMAGFAWRDGLLPTGRVLILWGLGFAAAAVALVAYGPYPVSMVNFPGLSHSPTHPPTAVLLLFGAAQSAVALALAPAVTRYLERKAGAWKAVVGANSMAMTIYLWHMTVGVAVLGAFDQLNLLGSALPGTGGWWMAKAPFVIAASALLALIVPRLARIERNALLADRPEWTGSPWLLMGMAVTVSFALKGWTSGSIAVALPCLVTVLGVTRWLERSYRPLHERAGR